MGGMEVIKKRICIFSAQYLPNTGGVEKYTYNLSKKLAERGYEITIVTSQVKELPWLEHQKNISICRFPCFPLMRGRFPVFKKNKQFYQIENWLKKQNFDLVIVNTRFYVESLYGVKFAEKKNVRGIVIEHGTSHLTFNNYFLDIFERCYEHFITWRVKTHCKEFYGVSKACLEWLNHFHIKGIAPIYNAVDLEYIEHLKNTCVTSYRAMYNIPEKSTIITFTGRLIREKGLLQLIEAIKDIKRSDVYLLIAGNGPLKNELEKYCDSNIIMVGYLDFPHIVALLEETDIYCLPSDSEGFPTAVLEAIACNCFVVTTQKGGAKELIVDDSLGIIMKDNCKETIEMALKKALADETERNKAVQKALILLNKEFTWEKAADKIEELL